MSRIDLYNTRRTMYNVCRFWKRDEDGVGNSEELTYYVQPDGIFYARPVNEESANVQTLFDSFMVDEHNIMLESNDNLSGLTQNCIVSFNNDIWRVENIRKKIRGKQSEFNPSFTYIWYIQLRR